MTASTSARVLLEIGDAHTFPTAGHVAAHAGLAPVTSRSCSAIRGEHPSRAGNKQLKRAMFLAVFSALRDPTSRAYYDRKRAEGNKHNAALICLARRRSDAPFAMPRDLGRLTKDIRTRPRGRSLISQERVTQDGCNPPPQAYP